MEMTKEQIADLLLKANNDLSNLECKHNNEWVKPNAKNIAEMLGFIADKNVVYRIKDNSVKELNIGLYKKVFRKKESKGITATIQMIDFDGNRVWIDNGFEPLDYFNLHWELVEA